MRRQGNKLSALEVARLKKPGRWGDGHGLWLQIGPGGSKSWCFCYKRQGRQHVMGLGPLYAVSLAEARVRARQANQCLADGGDPIAIKHATPKPGASSSSAPRPLPRPPSSSWRPTPCRGSPTISTDANGARRSRRRPRRSAPCRWSRSTRPSCSRPCCQCGSERQKPAHGCAVGSSASSPGRSLTSSTPGTNPAALDVLRDALPAKPKQKHHAALPYGELPAFMARLRERDSVQPGRSSSPSYARPGPARPSARHGPRSTSTSATWMHPRRAHEGKKPHRVPLSERAVEILRAMPRQGEFVFVNGAASLSATWRSWNC